MRVLFCHDGPLRKDENSNYYGVAHNDETFKRYYTIANKLSVVIRVEEISNKEAELKFSKITVSPFEVIECPNLSSLKGIICNRRKGKEVIEKAVLRSDYIVVRLPSMIGFFAINFAKKFNKPYLVELVACPWDAFWNHSLKGKLVAPFMYYKTKKYVKNANHVVYVTNEFLQRRYPTKGSSVNCSNVVLNDFNDSILEKRLKKIKSKNAENKLIIGTTAAIDVRYKGQQFVIKALGRLKKEGKTNIEYQLVGGGDPTYLKSLASKYDVVEQVKFLGPIPHEKVIKWLDTIDIYIQPSLQEGLPRALIEAMSRGLPAIGARTAGIPELLEDEYIFEHSKERIEEICKLILKVSNKEQMLVQSKRNFFEAKKYDRNIIENRRKLFFKDFIKNNNL